MMSTKRYLEERRKKEGQRRTLMLGLIIGGSVLLLAAIVVAFIGASRVNLGSNQIVQPDFPYNVEINQNALGDPDAPVVIHEYSDFGCGHCADFAFDTKKQLEDKYIQSGEVYLVFHSVGGLLGSPSTVQAAQAAYCAGDQDAFWPYHDLIFANQVDLFSKRGADISPTLKTFAEVLELDKESFNACLENGKYQDLVAQDNADAINNNITGTPSFLVNGKLLVGNQPYENFQQAIEEALASVANLN
jgi:protein-disulfide isomerase